MVSRWFVVPIVGTGARDDPERPKYGTDPGITGYSGNTHVFSDSKWSDLPWYPNEMYVVRFYAGREKELNDVEKYGDTWSERDTSEQEIANYLNDKTGLSLTFSEWEQRFLSS